MTSKRGAVTAKPRTWSECSRRARDEVMRELASNADMYKRDTWDGSPKYERAYRLAMKALRGAARRERP